MPIQTEDTGERIRDRIAELVGAQRYKVWFKNSTRVSCTDGFVKVGVPNVFIGGWIENHFAEAIGAAANDVLGREVPVSFAIEPDLFRQLRKSELNSQAAFVEKNSDRFARDRRVSTGSPSGHVRRLRGRLETFVVGARNRLAYSVAQNVVERPTEECAPLFIHGGCGVGKTHLLQGIANALAEGKPQVRCTYVTGEEFTNQFLHALRERRVDAFRHRFRSLHVLIVDDVHFIANKKATQEEFLHTFNTIDTVGLRVILASDAHPKMIGDLSESLVNRMVSGMVVRIERPDFDTRCEILRQKAATMHHPVPEPVIAYISEKVQTNVRELEGCLLKLVAYASLMKKQITPALARQALEDHLAKTGNILTVSDIELSVATLFGLSPADLHSSRKSRTIALARNVAMHIARTHTDLSFPEIARLMGNKNHTTVLLACRRIGAILASDGDVQWQSAAGRQSGKLRGLVERLEEQLRG
ncbi:MAG: chromosomal replication initiator protein DnaA [Planctomycetota bacterium]|nr:chromosomal replication initiator protein DnaA [Planctomycetota bacterium]